MSQEFEPLVAAAERKPASRGWRFVKWAGVVLLLIVVTLLLVQVALDLPHDNELGLRGGLKIEVDPGVEVYVRNQYVGKGTVELTWDDLLGTPERPPLAITIRSDTTSPSMKGMGGVTAEALAGEGAEIVWHRNGMKGSAQDLEPITFAWEQVLLRRHDGKLDLILVLDGAFPARTGTWRRFLVPLRLRLARNAPVQHFSDPPSGGISSVRGGMIPRSSIGSALWLRLLSKHETPPAEFALEIGQDGLWKPRR